MTKTMIKNQLSYLQVGHIGLFAIFHLVVPFSALLFFVGQHVSFKEFLEISFQPVILSAYQTTFFLALVAALLNTLFGCLIAWVLVRYEFPLKNLIDAFIDLPFFIPTSVSGLTLAVLLVQLSIGDNWIVLWLLGLNIEIVFSPVGAFLAMIFVSAPYAVRTIASGLQAIDSEIEEAAWCLGSRSWTTFFQVIAPYLFSVARHGINLSFTRAIGEYGSIVMLSSNLPFKDLTSSILLFQYLEEYSPVEAAVIGVFILTITLLLLFNTFDFPVGLKFTFNDPRFLQLSVIGGSCLSFYFFFYFSIPISAF